MFTECARLAERHPDLGDLFERLDSRFRELGKVAVLRPDVWANHLNVDLNQMRSALDMLAQEGLLCREEMIECRNCGLVALRSDYQEGLEEDGEYRCTDCDRPLTDETIQLITTYRSGEKWPNVASLPARSEATGLVELTNNFSSPADLQKLIEERESVDLFTAARYLGLTLDHVRRLRRSRKLVSVGKGRPARVSTKSLRDYKGQ